MNSHATITDEADCRYAAKALNWNFVSSGKWYSIYGCVAQLDLEDNFMWFNEHKDGSDYNSILRRPVCRSRNSGLNRFLSSSFYENQTMTMKIKVNRDFNISYKKHLKTRQVKSG